MATENVGNRLSTCWNTPCSGNWGCGELSEYLLEHTVQWQLGMWGTVSALSGTHRGVATGEVGNRLITCWNTPYSGNWGCGELGMWGTGDVGNCLSTGWNTGTAREPTGVELAGGKTFRLLIDWYPAVRQTDG